MIEFGLPALSVLLAVQLVGMAAAVLTRASEGSAWHARCTRLLLACLVLAGAATLVSFSLGKALGLASGTGLALTALLAVCDFRPQVGSTQLD